MEFIHPLEWQSKLAIAKNGHDVELIDLAGHLSILNFDSFNWEPVRHLIMKNCNKEILPTQLPDTPDIRITYVEFFGLTLYKNIKLLLHKCSNIKSMSFVRVNLNKYETDYRNFFIIHARELRELRFVGNKKITKDELHILDFFYRRVRITNLTTVSFTSVGSDWPVIGEKKKSKVSLSNKFTKASVNASTVIAFLLQNYRGLKGLKLARSGISLPNLTGNDMSVDMENAKLQLEMLEYDPTCPGIPTLLSLQDRLVSLTCGTEKSWLPSASLDALYSVVRRCAVTLKEVRVFQRIQVKFGSEENGNTATYQHDCEVYRYCLRLERLHLEVSQPPDIYVSESNGVKVGSILNPRFLPMSLTHLLIQFDHVSAAGMELFINRLATMIHLKFLVIQGNRAEPYKIKSTWIVFLVELPKIEIFEISGCSLDDLRAIDILMQSRPYLEQLLRVDCNSCLYWKPVSYETLNNTSFYANLQNNI